MLGAGELWERPSPSGAEWALELSETVLMGAGSQEGWGQSWRGLSAKQGEAIQSPTLWH